MTNDKLIKDKVNSSDQNLDKVSSKDKKIYGSKDNLTAPTNGGPIEPNFEDYDESLLESSVIANELDRVGHDLLIDGLTTNKENKSNEIDHTPKASVTNNSENSAKTNSDTAESWKRSSIDSTDVDNHTNRMNGLIDIVEKPTKHSRVNDSPNSVIKDSLVVPNSPPISPTAKLSTSESPTTQIATKNSFNPFDPQTNGTNRLSTTGIRSSSLSPIEDLSSVKNGSCPPYDVTNQSTHHVTDPTHDVTPSAEEDLSVKTWQKISVLVCVFVLLREFHPIESYFVKYLETLDAGYTRDVVRRSVYPVGTYSSLFLMVITFLITDYTRYKPIVLLDVLAGLLSYVLILDTPSMPVMWVQQVCIGFYHAGEVSYYSYMYSKIKDKASYQRATGRVKASIMIGRFVAGMTGQSVVLLFDTAVGYKILVYLSILGMTGATIWALLLPPVEDSVYFHQPPLSESSHLQPPDSKHVRRVAKTIWTDFKTAFSHVQILKWSVWWVLGMGGYILVITYNQVLWSSLVNEDPQNNRLMNGAVDAVFTIAGAISTFSIGKVDINWNRYGEFMLAGGTLVQGTLLIVTHSSHSLKLVYLNHIVFGCIHYTMLTIASSEVAKYLKRESFALVFGFNKFVALLSVSVFTLFIVQIENTPTRTLYLLFGIYFLLIGLIYCLLSLHRAVRTFRARISLP